MEGGIDQRKGCGAGCRRKPTGRNIVSRGSKPAGNSVAKQCGSDMQGDGASFDKKWDLGLPSTV